MATDTTFKSLDLSPSNQNQILNYMATHLEFWRDILGELKHFIKGNKKWEFVETATYYRRSSYFLDELGNAN